MPFQIHHVRNTFVSFYLIEWGDELVLIDGGFLGGVSKLNDRLTSIGKSFKDIGNILLTHGHLDHTINISKIKTLSGATVWGHPKDKDHIAGTYSYSGSSKICGFLEAIGRTAFNYQPFVLDTEIEDNQVLPIAGGIRVIHLPGHTIGHCGYYHLPTQILFSGDFYQYEWYREGLPPFFLNSCPGYFTSGIEKILHLNPAGIYSNHCDRSSPEIMFERFRKFAG
jgi:glyoxylase-like metal-dependent hydrolase (beta-lactamase superfamily II)